MALYALKHKQQRNEPHTAASADAKRTEPYSPEFVVDTARHSIADHELRGTYADKSYTVVELFIQILYIQRIAQEPDLFAMYQNNLRQNYAKGLFASAVCDDIALKQTAAFVLDFIRSTLVARANRKPT